MKIDGRFWLTKDNESFLGSGRVELLKTIEKTGSINAAAKEMKMSYKAAWERINSMNNLADEPLITRTTGGKGGGGTTLTPYAHKLIETYNRLNELHREFINRFAEAGDDPERLARILGRTFLTTSARNQFSCNIKSIEEYGINGLIQLQLDSGEEFYADITVKSIHSMGLVDGCSAYAIIKSSDVHICNTPPEDNKQLNVLPGRIEKVESINENTEVTFILNSGETLISVISLQESRSLHKNSVAYACIAKHNIILGL